MIVLNLELITKFIRKHANAKPPLIVWIERTRKAQWKKFDDVKKDFQSADIFGACVIFNIGGNNYRLIAHIDYPRSVVDIESILTHAEYDKEKWKSAC
ncbi:type II toxin-antitoxin system HigB family toxin [bacterium]|nr:type II toxin-antitoxin system HigB family toxin [bacterium]